jgi:hypothetical protein
MRSSAGNLLEGKGRIRSRRSQYTDPCKAQHTEIQRCFQNQTGSEQNSKGNLCKARNGSVGRERFHNMFTLGIKASYYLKTFEIKLAQYR